MLFQSLRQIMQIIQIVYQRRGCGPYWAHTVNGLSVCYLVKYLLTIENYNLSFKFQYKYKIAFFKVKFRSSFFCKFCLKNRVSILWGSLLLDILDPLPHYEKYHSVVRFSEKSINLSTRKSPYVTARGPRHRSSSIQGRGGRGGAGMVPQSGCSQGEGG